MLLRLQSVATTSFCTGMGTGRGGGSMLGMVDASVSFSIVVGRAGGVLVRTTTSSVWSFGGRPDMTITTLSSSVSSFPWIGFVVVVVVFRRFQGGNEATSTAGSATMVVSMRLVCVGTVSNGWCIVMGVSCVVFEVTTGR